MKKILSILMTLVFAMSIMTGCSAAESTENTNNDFVLTMQIGNPVMTVNGAEAEIDPGRGTAPVVQNDRTLVPIRAIIEAMGGTVNWDEETQTVLLEYNSDVITLNIGNTAAYLNETMNTLDVAPATINDRTMLPIRFIAESFRFNVNWAEETQTVTITKSTSAPVTTPAVVPSNSGKTLVVYYSATGNTERVANYVVDAANADVFKLEPVKPYTDADLNYSNNSSRVVYEHEHPEAQDIELVSTAVPNWESYDTVFIGYPIWWHAAAWPVNRFVTENDFTGKTVIPFSTSASSGEAGGEALAEMAKTGDWKEGMGFRSRASESDVADWVNSLK